MHTTEQGPTRTGGPGLDVVVVAGAAVEAVVFGAQRAAFRVAQRPRKAKVTEAFETST